MAFQGLAYQARILRFPYEFIPSEAGMAQSARALRQGQDPWSAPLAAASFNDYSCVTPALGALGMALTAADALTVLRWLSALALILGAALLWKVLRDEGAEPLECAAAALVFYLGMLYFEGASAKPDAVAVALYVAVLGLGMRGRERGALWAGFLAALSFFCKVYVVIAVPLLVVLLFLQGKRPAARALALSFGVSLVVLGALVWRLFPNYYWATLSLLGNAVGYELDFLLIQLVDLLKLHLPLALGGALFAVRAWRAGKLAWPRGQAALWVALAVAVFVVMVAGPGAHRGAFYIYYLQLLLPPLLVAAVLWARQWRTPWALVALVLVADAACVQVVGAGLYPSQTQAESIGWPQAEALVVQAPQGFYPPIMTTLLARHGAFVADNDHTHSMHFAVWRGRESPLAVAGREHYRAMGQRLRQGAFQAVVCGGYWPCPEALIQKSYRKQGQLCLGSPVQAPACFDVFIPFHPTTKEHP